MVLVLCCFCLKVHEAVTRDGERVAVKVQFPRLRAQFDRDMNVHWAVLTAASWLFKGFLSFFPMTVWFRPLQRCDQTDAIHPFLHTVCLPLVYHQRTR